MEGKCNANNSNVNELIEEYVNQTSNNDKDKEILNSNCPINMDDINANQMQMNQYNEVGKTETYVNECIDANNYANKDGNKESDVFKLCDDMDDKDEAQKK
eukprot:458551_1